MVGGEESKEQTNRESSLLGGDTRRVWRGERGANADASSRPCPALHCQNPGE